MWHPLFNCCLLSDEFELSSLFPGRRPALAYSKQQDYDVTTGLRQQAAPLRAAVSSEQSVGEQEVAIAENNFDEEQLPDIKFVATTKAHSIVRDRELEMVGEKERELGRMLNQHEEE